MNIIFDIGAVLIDYSNIEFLTQAFHDVEIVKRLSETIFKSDEWRRMDRGDLSSQQVADILSERVPELKREIEYSLKNYFLTMKPMPGMRQLLEQLKNGGHILYYLSNMPQSAAEHLIEHLPVMRLFSGGVFSYAVHMQKPESEIYQVLLNTFHIAVDTAIFIDDMQENIVAAKALHIDGVRYCSTEQLQQELIARGIFQ